MTELSYTLSVMPNSVITVDGFRGDVLYYRRYAKWCNYERV